MEKDQPSKKLSDYEKLLCENKIYFLILFVLWDAILLNSDFQKRSNCYKQNFGLDIIHLGSQCQKYSGGKKDSHI